MYCTCKITTLTFNALFSASTHAIIISNSAFCRSFQAEQDRINLVSWPDLVVEQKSMSSKDHMQNYQKNRFLGDKKYFYYFFWARLHFFITAHGPFIISCNNILLLLLWVKATGPYMANQNLNFALFLNLCKSHKR